MEKNCKWTVAMVTSILTYTPGKGGFQKTSLVWKGLNYLLFVVWLIQNGFKYLNRVFDIVLFTEILYETEWWFQTRTPLELALFPIVARKLQSLRVKILVEEIGFANSHKNCYATLSELQSWMEPSSVQNPPVLYKEMWIAFSRKRR